MRKKKIIADMLLNIIATALPTIFLQLLILPLLAKQMTSDNYGFLVTILALLNVVPATFGNVLNNIRLLYDSEYRINKVTGDFNILLTIGEIINSVCIVVFIFIYNKSFSPTDIILTICVGFVWLLREYYIVAYRLIINYKSILFSNIIMVIGYGIGYAIFQFCYQWQVIYLCGFFFSLIYIAITSDIWREPFKRTFLFELISKESLLLLIAGIFTRIIIYADKLLIYPVLGGTTVAIYYAATIFGKVVSLVLNPVSSVALTYLSKKKAKDNKSFNYTLIIGSIVCFFGYFFCLIISRPVLKILYPDYVDQAMKYIVYTTGVTVLNALISLINPFIMKFFSMKWQIAINGATTLVYVGLSMSLLHFWGLYGFCIGSLITYTLKVLFMIYIYYKCKSIEDINKSAL